MTSDKVREAIGHMRFCRLEERERKCPELKSTTCGNLLADRVEELELEVELLTPMTPEQADAAFDAVTPIPISEQEIDRIVKFVETEEVKKLADEVRRLRAALQAVREAYERKGDDYGSSKFWGRIAHAIVEHVLPLTEGKE